MAAVCYVDVVIMETITEYEENKIKTIIHLENECRKISYFMGLRKFRAFSKGEHMFKIELKEYMIKQGFKEERSFKTKKLAYEAGCERFGSGSYRNGWDVKVI